MTRFLRHWLTLLFALALALPGSAQAPALDTFLKGLQESASYSGSVLVVRGGDTLYRGDHGFRDQAMTVRHDRASVYYIPGVDETILATLVMMARDKGLLALDQPLGTYRPEFRGQRGPLVRDLLCHAAGFQVFRMDEGQHAGPGTLTLGALAAQIAQRPPILRPGTLYDWESNDYALAGYLLERVAGKPFPAVLADWVLAPLGLESSGAGLAPEGMAFARGAGFAKSQALLAHWQGGCLPSECVYASLDDLDRFFRALTSGKLVAPASWREMQTPVVGDPWGDESGLGLSIQASGVLWTIGFDNWGNHSLFLFDPRYDLRILVLSNRWLPATGASFGATLRTGIYAALGLKE